MKGGKFGKERQVEKSAVRLCVPCGSQSWRSVAANAVFTHIPSLESRSLPSCWAFPADSSQLPPLTGLQGANNLLTKGYKRLPTYLNLESLWRPTLLWLLPRWATSQWRPHLEANSPPACVSLPFLQGSLPRKHSACTFCLGVCV